MLMARPARALRDQRIHRGIDERRNGRPVGHHTGQHCSGQRCSGLDRGRRLVRYLRFFHQARKGGLVACFR